MTTLELIADEQAELVTGGFRITLIDLSGSTISIGNRGALAQFASISDANNVGNGGVQNIIARRPYSPLKIRSRK
jgi:hypothetical protein